MGFHNVRFPMRASWGYAGGPQFRTQVHTTDSGFEERVQRWPRPRWAWNAPKDLQAPDVIQDVLDFFICRGGAANAFRFRDWLDYSTNPSNGQAAPTMIDQYLGEGDGTRVSFQLQKLYESGDESVAVPITLPCVPAASSGAYGDTANTVLVAAAGVAVTTGWTVNGSTGELLFTAAPTGSVTAGCYYDKPVRFAADDDRLEASYDVYDGISVSSLPLVEVRGETVVPEIINYGGCHIDAAFASSYTATPAMGRLHVLTPIVSGLSVYMPTPAGFGSGWAIFTFINQSGSLSFTVRDDLGGSIGTVSNGQRKYVALRDNGDGTATWELF